MTPFLHCREIAPTPRWRALLDRVTALDTTLVAFSGGVDSALLAKVAHDMLGARAVAVTAVSASLAASELQEARELARRIGIEHVEIETRELDDASYAANSTSRCYWCKSHLFIKMEAVRAQRGLATSIYGAITDDLGDDRPGMDAAAIAGAQAPLLDAGLSKIEVREASRRLGLPTWDKPAMACLASRIPHGTTVTAERLGAVERAEHAVRAFGFRQVRVRHRGDTARLEVDPLDVSRALELSAQIALAVATAGFPKLEIDPDGYGALRLSGDRTLPILPDARN